MRRILCYGDSNTWGYRPGDGDRHPEEVRWTGILAQELGPEFRVIEDGLNGRTTVYDDPFDACRNGRTGLGYALLSHKPLDMVILMLGTNDLKYTDVYGAARGAAALVQLLQGANAVFPSTFPVFPAKPKILLVAPIPISAGVDDGEIRSTLYGTHETSLLFPREYARVAKELEVDFLDAGAFAAPSPLDCIHLDESGHRALAGGIAGKVRQMWREN